MSLYTIEKSIEELLTQGYQQFIDEETGEFDESGFNNALEQLEIDRTVKIENYGLVIKNLRADIEGLKAEKEAIENRKKSKEKTIERLSKYLALALDGKPFETEKIALNFRRSKQVQIVDETKIPEEFMKIQIIEKKEPNKILIKKLIKDGLTIEGANLLEVQNLQIK